MSSGATSARSIAARLVILFTIASVLLLCAGLGLLYWIVIQHAFEEDNEGLADKAFGLRSDLESAGGPSTLREELKILRAGERVGYFVRIIDAAGNPLAETPGMNELLPATVFPPPDQKIDRPKTQRTDGRLFACVATQVEAGGPNYTL